MNVTITGPNAHRGMFHVHRTGCADLQRGVYRTIPLNVERYEEDHDSAQSVVECVYSDIIGENPGTTWENYAGEFRFFPCTESLPTTTAQPRRGTVRDAYGDPCPRAATASYPLRAHCDSCGADIVCADGSADWAHRRSLRGAC